MNTRIKTMFVHHYVPVRMRPLPGIRTGSGRFPPDDEFSIYSFWLSGLPLICIVIGATLVGFDVVGWVRLGSVMGGAGVALFGLVTAGFFGVPRGSVGRGWMGGCGGGCFGVRGCGRVSSRRA